MLSADFPDVDPTRPLSSRTAPRSTFARQVALHAPHDARDVGIFLSGRDRVLVIKGYMDSLAAQFGNGATFAGEDGEAQTPEVICYGMVK